MRTTRNIIITLDDTFTILSNLHIKVTVNKSMLTLPNSSRIEVFNLSTETFLKLKKQPTLSVKVDGNQVYKGKVLNVSNTYDGVDWLCTIYCNDITLKPYASKQYSTFSKGTSKKEVINSIASKISSSKPLGLEELKNCKKGNGSLLKEFKVAYTKESDLLNAVKSMFKGCGLQVFKDDGVVKIQNGTVLKNSKTQANQSFKVGEGGTVPNLQNLLKFDTFFKAPTISNDSISLLMPLNSSVKLGLGFKVKPKSYELNFEKPYLMNQLFENRVFRIVEIVHITDNYSNETETTQLRGELVK